ncbi:hypothetical protein SNEBB_009631 [Seison nebaliae]|nr:hypothetical protein SNEBB_009631 [Seison nebaliae]
MSRLNNDERWKSFIQYNLNDTNDTDCLSKSFSYLRFMNTNDRIEPESTPLIKDGNCNNNNNNDNDNSTDENSEREPALNGTLNTKDQVKPKIDICTFQILNVAEVNYLWTVNCFSFSREELPQQYCSSAFHQIDMKQRIKNIWYIRLYSRGVIHDTKEYIGIYLYLKKSTHQYVNAKFSFSIIDALGEEIGKTCTQRAYRFVAGKDWGFKQFMKRSFLVDERNRLLPNDSLTIRCNIRTTCGCLNFTRNVDDQQEFRDYRYRHISLQMDTCYLLNTASMSDVIIRCPIDSAVSCGRSYKTMENLDIVKPHNDGWKEQRSNCFIQFYAHTSILSYRCDVFKEILSNIKENVQIKRITFFDIDSAIMHEILRFIYTGHVKLHAADFAPLDLLSAAHKFKLKGMKKFSEESLDSQMNEENVVGMLFVSHVYDLPQLFDSALTFINFVSNDNKTTLTGSSWNSVFGLVKNIRRIATQNEYQKEQKILIVGFAERILRSLVSYIEEETGPTFSKTRRLMSDISS